MKDFFKLTAVKAVLALIALVLLGLAIWFLGPYLVFGEMHPLGSVAIRVTAIVLLTSLVVLLLLRWTLSPVLVAVLCVLVWNVGPLLAFGAQGAFKPLASEWVRLWVIGLILLCYAIWGIYKLVQLMRTDEKFLQRVLSGGQDKQALAKAEIRTIRGMARKAVSQLRQMHLTMAGGTGSIWSGLRRIVEGKRYLYELPWYMVIGIPGSGKSSMVLNAGLRFPVPEQMSAASAQLTMAKLPGTQYCDWWLTNDAVLIDTAGRYTDQRPQENPSSSDAEEAAQTGDNSTTAGATTTETEKTKKATDALGSLHQKNEAEWLGFLGVLRQVRPRAPVNGALLAVDVAELIYSSPQKRLLHAAHLRERLSELRTQLGIRFPVYVMLTKTDVLRGFTEYFSTLTSESRAQVWGFSLPWKEAGLGLSRWRKNKTAKTGNTQANAGAQADWPLTQQISHEFSALVQRIHDGVATRLQEEFEEDRRQALYVLPYELSSIEEPLKELLDAVFADSRYDTTQIGHMLRGVYLNSSMQIMGDSGVRGERSALIPRLAKQVTSLGVTLGFGPEKLKTATTASRRSYFLADALQRVVFHESHLVKPNLKWEARMRLLRLIGHAVVLTLFFWLSGALLLSYNNNLGYLADVGQKTEVLTEQMKQLLVKNDIAQTEKVLGLAQTLPTHTGLDLGDPSSAYLYGLYSAEPIQAAALKAYGDLLDRLVLPVIIERQEQVMSQAVANEDAKLAYDTLRVNLLLHDLNKYNSTKDAAQNLRQWITQDWQDSPTKAAAANTAKTANAANAAAANATTTDPLTGVKTTLAPAAAAAPTAPDNGLAMRFGNSTAMVAHLEQLFSGQRVVQSSTARNENLVRTVRAFLEKRSTSERLYERAIEAVEADVPQDFSLVRVLGPQAGTLFSRLSGQTLEQGVPGLFTYDGYHQIFAKRLPELVAYAQQDDAWVMGRLKSQADDASQAGEPQRKTGLPTAKETQAMVEEIRRQYLSEYAELWSDFLADIRLVNSDKSGTLAFELNVLRQLNAADSPLVRLSRLAARETTLSRPLIVSTGAEKSLLEKAAEEVEQKKQTANTNLGLRPEQQAERQYVDSRFAALREVVTGKPDGGAPSPAKSGMEAANTALGEFYTMLVVADNAIGTNSLPPNNTESVTKLRIEASKLPAPLREVLLDVSNRGTDKVALGAANILRAQAQAQMDRLVGLLALTVGEPCKRNIAGRYPFSASTQEASIEDVNAMFAADGAADEYFKKYLLPLVDTSSRPWRYKSPTSANLMAGTENMANGQAIAPATTGPTLTGELLKLLAQSGPNPDVFAQVGQIRDMFFRDAGAKRLSWRGDYKVVSLDPSITELVIDLDGQVQRYSHGPIQTIALQWPGPRSGTMAELQAQPRIKADTSSLQQRGPWALFRLVEQGKIINSAQSGRIAVEYQLDNRRAVLEFSSGGPSPFNSQTLRNFSCPGRVS